MDLKKLPNHILLLLSVCFLLLGLLLVFWLVGNLPSGGAQPAQQNSAATSLSPDDRSRSAQAAALNQAAVMSDTATTGDAIAPGPPPTPVTITIGLAPGAPMSLLTTTLPLTGTTIITNYVAQRAAHGAEVALTFDFESRDSAQTYRYTFAAATRFDTVDPVIAWTALQQLWQDQPAATAADAAENANAAVESADAPSAGPTFAQIAVLTDTLPALTEILGDAGNTVRGYASTADVVAASWGETATVALLPFDLLTPRLVVLAVDGQKPIENANRFDATTYPLAGDIYAHLTTTRAPARAVAEAVLAALPPGNRDPARLTVIAMTGVTAMVRLTAAEMDKRGAGWPAAVVGPELAAADITAISNEVPFVPGCETDTRMDNLTFCSKPEYMQALTDSGVDIIGLTGNHQNDFGRTDAITSLDIYDEAGLPVYGGGRNKEEAFAPLYLEHNGNRLAFLGANSYGPTFAWATDDEPGSAEFDLNIMSATIRNIKELGRADVVLAELQYQESYDVIPLVDQRQNFNALVHAGADIVTGVQSHVPQAIEFTDGKLILYGLGNLYFDQMWSQSTREGLIVKHTIYNNRHISTQIFTTLLYDYGQPRWTEPAENRALLERVFGASFW